jgi:Protein of unknown function (DUF2798)
MTSATRETALMMFTMTFLMDLILSAWFTWQTVGFSAGFVSAWVTRFFATYVIVMPTVLVVAPIAQRIARGINRRIESQAASLPKGEQT